MLLVYFFFLTSTINIFTFSARVIFQSWQLCATSSVVVSVTWQLDYSEFICNILLCYNLNLFVLCYSWTFSFYNIHYVNGGLICHVHICYTFVISNALFFLNLTISRPLYMNLMYLSPNSGCCSVMLYKMDCQLGTVRVRSSEFHGPLFFQSLSIPYRTWINLVELRVHNSIIIEC